MIKATVCKTVIIGLNPIGASKIKTMTTLKLGSRGEDVKTLQRKLNLSVDGIFGPITEEAVKEFQRTNHLSVDGIVGSATWSKLGLSTGSRTINKIIVHCSATPENRDYTVKDIDSWHRQRGFNCIGYHYVIYRDGTIVEGRSESMIGAHCTGQNANSIGVCYIGGMDVNNKYPKDTRTPAQKVSLLKLLKELRVKYPKARIHSHRDFAAKDCPSFNATKEYESL